MADNSNLKKPRRGAGRVFLGPYVSALDDRVLKDTGNTAKFTLQPEVESTDIPDTSNGAGGTYFQDNRVKGVNITLEFDNWSPMAWAAANMASVTDVTAGAVAAEPHKAHLGALVRFDHIADMAVAVLVKDSTATTTYELGTDYTLDENGFGIMPVAGGAIEEGDVLKVSYTKRAHQVLEGLVKPGAEYSVFFAGQNGIGATPESLDVFRVVLAGDGGQDIIMTKPGPLKLKGTVLVDPTVAFDPAHPLSRFYRIKSA